MQHCNYLLQGFITGLQENTTLKSLNVESNCLTGDMIVRLLEAINTNQTLTELKVANQKVSHTILDQFSTVSHGQLTLIKCYQKSVIQQASFG